MNGVGPGCPRSVRSTLVTRRATGPAVLFAVRGWLGIVVSSA